MNVLITGASSGIGRATAHYLHIKGFNIAGTSRHPERISAPFPMFRLDLHEPGSAEECIGDVIKSLGQIDVLINNAGIGICGPLENTSHDEALQLFEANYFGAVRMNNAVLPHFKARNSGIIIHISSIGGLIGLPFQGHYSASKFALEGYTEALRLEVRPFGIVVFNINPGDFKTEFTANRKIIAGIGPEYKERFGRFLAMYENDEQNGSDPTAVARLVEKLIARKNGHAVRYLCGSLMQTAAAKTKSLIGNKLFEKLLIRLWKA